MIYEIVFFCRKIEKLSRRNGFVDLMGFLGSKFIEADLNSSRGVPRRVWNPSEKI